MISKFDNVWLKYCSRRGNILYGKFCQKFSSNINVVNDIATIKTFYVPYEYDMRIWNQKFYCLNITLNDKVFSKNCERLKAILSGIKFQCICIDVSPRYLENFVKLLRYLIGVGSIYGRLIPRITAWNIRFYQRHQIS